MLVSENLSDLNFLVFRDNLFRLKLNSLTQLEHASWTAPSKKISTCQDKGQTSEDCHNFIKVLLSNGKFIFTCGTNAYSPMCTWREVSLLKYHVEKKCKSKRGSYWHVE